MFAAASVAAQPGTAATSSTVVGAEVLSATSIDTTACATGELGRTDLGMVPPGSMVLTSLDCGVDFGSSNDTSMLLLQQRDGGGAAMLGGTSSNVVGWWSMEGSGADQSTNGNTLATRNGAGYGAGPGSFGQALTVSEATTQHGEATWIAPYDLSPPFTVEGWFRTGAGFPGSQNSPTMISKGAGSTNRNFAVYVSSGGILRASLSAGGVFQAVGGQPVADGLWHHFAMVVRGTDPTATLAVYLDGQLDAELALTAPVDASQVASILVGRGGGLTNFHGELDEVRIYASALPAGQVATHATGTVPDYGGPVSWASDAAFGACLRSTTGDAAVDGTTWPVDGNGTCADGDADPWRAIAPTTAAGAKLAFTPVSGSGGVRLRFQLKAGAAQAPGAYIAPLTFSVIAPNT